ncbi:MAG: hypothetical protein R3F56_18535 [Planctomycetota bacterium]
MNVLLALLAVLGLVGGLAYGRNLLPAERTRRAQRRLHDGLAAANGLSTSESSWLWELASAARLDHPAHLFVRPSVYDAQVTSRGAEPALAAAVRRKLFGA